jgi:putative DNA primase/helicase
LVWAGHHWEWDSTGKALNSVEDVALLYMTEAEAIGRQIRASSNEEEAKRLQGKSTKLSKRASRLRAAKGRNNTLHFASTCGEGSLIVTGDQLDQHPMLLACPNGVVDLETGTFRAGEPGDLMMKVTAVDYPTGPEIFNYLASGEGSPCPAWESFLVEILNGRKHCAEYVQRLLGYSITGMVREHIVAIFFGPNGRNGKGTLIETLLAILGPMAGPIASEMLLDQGRAQSSSSATADLMHLGGLRLAFANETEAGRRFSTSKVKLLTGGDRIVARAPHDKTVTTIEAHYQLFLATNTRPKAPPEDSAFWSRVHLLEFELSFVDSPSAPHERPIDRRLKEKLEAEGPGILAWLVRGCLQYQSNGLKPPAEVLAATAQYRRGEDILADFLEARCDIDEQSTTTAKHLHESFKGWWLANVSEKVPSVKWFGDAMSRRFSKDLGGPGKTVRYFGLSLRPSIDF